LTATYNVSGSGTKWQIAGAQGSLDRGTTVLGTLKATKLGTATVTLNTAGIAVVQSWVNDSTINHGFIIQNYLDANADSLQFTSREGSTAAQRPKLTIVSRAPNPVAVSPLKTLPVMTNPANAYDVNDDAQVTPGDVLMIVNQLNRAVSDGSNAADANSFPDVSGDSSVTSLDALLVINYLNEVSGNLPAGESAAIVRFRRVAWPDDSADPVLTSELLDRARFLLEPSTVSFAR
jgi:hypothetical protein